MSFFVRALALGVGSALSLSGCGASSSTSQQPSSTTVVVPAQKTVVVEQTLPFPTNAFVQGLEFDEATGSLVVGTGWQGESEVFRTQLGSTAREGAVALPANQFGEGITIAGDTLWQITWKDQVAYKRNAATFAELDTIAFEGQGWGLCSFDDTLVMSDGSGELSFRNPATFEKTGTLTVSNAGQATSALNELECVTAPDGSRSVYANVFMTTDIYRIDASTGEVTEIIDASSLPNNAASDSNHVLNGIAYLPESDSFALTGKRWPDLYRVRFEGN